MNITELPASTQHTALIKTAASCMEGQAFTLADMYVVADVETNCVDTVVDGVRHYDSRPWLDPREQPSEFIDMATAAIDYALQRGLITRHLQQPHMLRVQRSADLKAS
jgi:hypothetical protein